MPEDHPQTPRQNTLYVASLEKGFRLLEAFNEERCEMSLTELSRTTGLDKSATQRFANTLVTLGYLEKDPATRRFRPAVKILERAHAYLWSNPLVQLATPRLLELSRTLQCNVNLAIPDGTDIIYIFRAPWHRSRFAATVGGRRLPALNTSSGRAILSALPAPARQEAAQTWPLHQYTSKTTTNRAQILKMIETAAEDGYSISREEVLTSETATAAPLLTSTGTPLAAVQISFSSPGDQRATPSREALSALIETAASLETTARTTLP